MTVSSHAPDTRQRVNAWHAHALCGEETAELFFPVGSTGSALRQIQQAKAFCHRCPVMQQCLNWSLDTQEPHGVWGGLSEEERNQLLGRRRSDTDPSNPRGSGRRRAECGTLAAYHRHVKHKETIDDACREAKRRVSAEQRRRTKATVS